MKNIVLASVALFGSSFLFAQEKVNIGDFNTLKVYDKIPVELVASSKNYVELEGLNADDIKLENTSGELRVKLTGTKILQGDGSNVIVHYKSLQDIQASQGSKIHSDDTLKASKLNITSNEGSSIKLSVSAKNLEVKINSGGEVILSGTANVQTVVANSGGKYYSKTLKAENSTLTTNAGGYIEATSTESVDAKTRAGGVIDIYGKPAQRNQKKVIGGKINFK